MKRTTGWTIESKDPRILVIHSQGYAGVTMRRQSGQWECQVANMRGKPEQTGWIEPSLPEAKKAIELEIKERMNR